MIIEIKERNLNKNNKTPLEINNSPILFELLNAA